MALLSCSEAPGRRATPGLVPDTKPAPPVRWLEVTVPRETTLRLAMVDRIASDASRRGDQFRCRLVEAVLVGDLVAVPSGSIVHGVVGEATGASGGFGRRGGSLLVGLSRISTPTGAGKDLTARLVGVGAGAPAETRVEVAVEAAPSDLGRLLGRPEGITVPGTTFVAGSRGTEAVIAPETPLECVLEEPLVIKVKQ